MIETIMRRAEIDDISEVSGFHYRVYGLRVSSNLPLPLASLASEPAETADVVIRRLDAAPPVPDGPVVASLPCQAHGTDMIEYRGPGGTWIWLHGIGTCHVRRSQVDVYPDSQTDEHSLGLALVGPVLLFVRHMLGYPSLHASAVVAGQEAIGFLGVQRQGKSTMAASFIRRGASLLSDDALPLLPRAGGIETVPGPPFMKVWTETARHTLGLAEDLPNLVTRCEKKVLDLQGRYSTANGSARLHTLFFLDRYDSTATGRSDVIIRSVGRREALLGLLAHTSGRAYLLPHDDALALPMYGRLVAQTRVRVLTYPSGFEHQEMVYAQILADLEEE